MVVWKIVGGADKGGILVRDGEGLRSLELSRLATGTLVEELELRGTRMKFKLLEGCGPPHGWISLQVAGKNLAEPSVAPVASRSIVLHLGREVVLKLPMGCAPRVAELKSVLRTHPNWTRLDVDLAGFKKPGADDASILADTDTAEWELEVVYRVLQWQKCTRAALKTDATEDQANEALARLQSETSPDMRLAKSLVLWKWHRYDRCLRELGVDAWHFGAEAATRSQALLALEICLGRWPEALALAEEALKEGSGPHAAEAAELARAWLAGAAGNFSPSSAEFVPGIVEVHPGLRQMDARIPSVDDVSLGVRLFLQMEAGAPRVSQPLVLYFHGNAENVDTYKDPKVFAPLQEAEASALIVDFRGYGFSTGSGPSLSSLNVDAERVCDALPGFLSSRGLPWPWPGGLTLFGRSMGGICACHLAGLRGDIFHGVVLESAMCGSHAPGAAPPPEPPSEGSGMGAGGGNRFAPPELTAAASQAGDLSRALLRSVACQELQDLLTETDLGFVHMMGSEDKLRGFTGRLLILHGELDTIVPVSHARRLCDAAASATRRLVTLSKGHNDISSSDKYVQALRKFLSGG